MKRNPITFDEKVDARITRKGRGNCWPWTGALDEGDRPKVNGRDVMRYIYERERGPIPPGMILKRIDHGPTCRQAERCSHKLCVNPWHVEPRLPTRENWGIYPRENSRGVDLKEYASEYKRRKRKKDGSNGDSQGLDAAPHGR